MEGNIYTIVAYSIRSGRYIPYVEMTSFEDAVVEARHLGLGCRNNTFRHMNGEDIDWIEIYENWETPDSEIKWGSYDLCVKSCANV